MLWKDWNKHLGSSVCKENLAWFSCRFQESRRVTGRSQHCSLGNSALKVRTPILSIHSGIVLGQLNVGLDWENKEMQHGPPEAWTSETQSSLPSPHYLHKLLFSKSQNCSKIGYISSFSDRRVEEERLHGILDSALKRLGELNGCNLRKSMFKTSYTHALVLHRNLESHKLSSSLLRLTFNSKYISS